MNIKVLIIGASCAVLLLAMWWSSGLQTSESSLAGSPDLSSSSPESAAIINPPSQSESAGDEVPSARQVAPGGDSGSASVPVAASTPEIAGEDWSAYEKLSIDDIDKEWRRIRAEVGEKSAPLLRARLDAGFAELITTEEDFNYRHRKEDFQNISSIHVLSGRGVYRTELPRVEYPELYEQHDRMLALMDLQRAKVREQLAATVR